MASGKVVLKTVLFLTDALSLMLLSSDWLLFLPTAANWIHLEHVPPLLSTAASITNCFPGPATLAAQLCLSLTSPWLPGETLLRPHCSQLSPSQPTPPLSRTAEVGAEITRLPLSLSTFISFGDNFSLN